MIKKRLCIWNGLAGRGLIGIICAYQSSATRIGNQNGGSAISGEDSLHAALRETREELGITLNPGNGEIFKKYPYPHSSGDGAAYIVVWVFMQEIDRSTVVLQPDETCDVIWAAKDKIRQLIRDGLFINYSYMEELFSTVG